jgi:hypothetical protein
MSYDSAGVGAVRFQTPAWASGALESLLDLPALQTSRTYVRSPRNAIDENANSLKIRVEPPLGGDHGVATVVPETGPLATYAADLRHHTSISARPSTDTSQDVATLSGVDTGA